jgi:hypothetical protein
MSPRIDIVGQRFDRLTAIRPVVGGWECRCECGNTRIVRGAGIHTGNPAAWKLAATTLGLCWVCYAGEYLSGYGESFRRAAMVASGMSILTGVAAGLALLLV